MIRKDVDAKIAYDFALLCEQRRIGRLSHRQRFHIVGHHSLQEVDSIFSTHPQPSAERRIEDGDALARDATLVGNASETRGNFDPFEVGPWRCCDFGNREQGY